MKPTLENLESLQINASLETVEQLSGELRQARKDIEQWKEEYAKLQILQNDTNAKYSELVIKYERLEGEFKGFIKIAKDYKGNDIRYSARFSLAIELAEDYFKAGLPTDK